MRDRVTEYAKRVIDGEYVVGELHILACKRHLNDLKKQKIFFCDKIYKILLDMFDKVSLEGTDRHGSISF